VTGGTTEPLDVGCLRLAAPEEAAGWDPETSSWQLGCAPAPATVQPAAGCGGRPRYFCNVASCGAGASAARRVQALKGWPFGG
jgi:hypothetical protein